MAYLGDHILPGRNRNHVSGIAAKAVHPSAAPGQQYIRHIVPQLLVTVVQMGQILPHHTPGAGVLNLAGVVACQPLRVGGVQAGGPPGMIDGDIDENLAPARVHGIHQFQKLLQRGGFGIEYRQRRIHFGEAQSGIWAAKASHAAVNGGGGVNGQQLQIAASQPPHDKIQFGDQIPEGPRRRDHCIAGLVQIFNGL